MFPNCWKLLLANVYIVKLSTNLDSKSVWAACEHIIKDVSGKSDAMLALV